MDEVRAGSDARLGMTILDRYTLIRLVGSGGMGDVYEAQSMNGARVALKLLHRHVSQVPGMRDRFHREALIARRIDHQGIVRIFDDGVSQDGDLFLAMELLDGQTVDARAELAGGALPMQEVVAIASATLDVLEAAHKANVIHRDLKPENLFLTTARALKVLDFGIARLDTPDVQVKRTKTGIILGTPAFMAPEQARGKGGNVDQRTDVWAMGAILYTLLSGRPVHHGNDVTQVIAAAAIRPALSLARVVQAPLPLVRLVDRALAFDQGERYASAREMRTALVEAVAEIRANVTAATQPAEPPSQTHQSLGTLVEAEGDGGDTEVANPFRVVAVDERSRGALVEFFSLLEKALLAITQYGQEHPETERRFAAASAHAVAWVRGEGSALEFNVTPYSFAAGGDELWEPRPPFDRVPYQLFADGVRILSFVPGIHERELDGFLRLITRDRAREFSPEDDFVTLLWEADLEHVQHQAIDSFGDGDLSRRNRFEIDVRRVQSEGGTTQRGQIAKSFAGGKRGDSPAAKHGARVAALLTRGQGLDLASVASAEAMLAVDPVAHARALDIPKETLSLLGARLVSDEGGIEAKFLRSVGLAWSEAKGSGTSETLGTQLRGAVTEVLLARPDAGVRMAAALCRIVSSPAAPAGVVVLSPASLASILGYARQEPVNVSIDDLRVVASALDVSFVDVVVSEVLAAPEAPQAEPLVAYLARPEMESDLRLGDMIAAAGEEQGLAIIRTLVRLNTPGARAAIAKASTSKYPVVRVEALGHLEGASSERLRLELKAFLEDEDAGVRLKALSTIEQHRVRIAGPSLVMRIKGPKFDSLSLEERRQALQTLATLATRRAEEVCIEIVGNGSLIPSESREQSRALAAELLGHIGRSDASIEALDAAAGARWRSSEKLRVTAQAAKTRLSQMPPPPLQSVPPPQYPSVPPPQYPSAPPPDPNRRNRP